MPYGLPGVDNATIEIAAGSLRVKDASLAGDKFADWKTYLDPSDGFTIEHDNKAVVHIVLTVGGSAPPWTQGYITTDGAIAIADGSVVGQELRIVVESNISGYPINTGALTIKNNANTKLLGDWSRLFSGGSTVPVWLELVWDGSNWLENNTNDGIPATKSGSNAHAEGTDTVSSAHASHAEGMACTGSGDVAHAEGYYTTASGDASHAMGSYADTMALDCLFAQAGGKFTSSGDAQYVRFVTRKSITHNDTNWYSLWGGFLNNVQLVVPTDSVMMFDGLLVGTTQGCSKSFGFIFNGLVENDGGTTSLLASNVSTIYDTDDTSFDAQVVADDTNDAFDIQVKDSDSGGDTVRWVAIIRAAMVKFPA